MAGHCTGDTWCVDLLFHREGLEFGQFSLPHMHISTETLLLRVRHQMTGGLLILVAPPKKKESTRPANKGNQLLFRPIPTFISHRHTKTREKFVATKPFAALFRWQNLRRME